MDFQFKRVYRGPLKAAILDWAGTIIDFGCMAPAMAFTELFRRRGVEITLAQAREPMGLNKRDHIERIIGMEPVARAWEKKHGRPCSGADVDAMYREFIPIQLEAISRRVALVPGAHSAVAEIRRRGMKIGTTTGYDREMLGLLLKEARARGFEPESSFCADDAPAGRPAPWLCLLNAMRLGVYPMEACVKIGDTIHDIAEGLNAGMWTVGVILAGNEMGLEEDDLARLPPPELRRRRDAAAARFASAGAHCVLDSLADLSAALDALAERLARGEKP